jgi:hypothetical protein
MEYFKKLPEFNRAPAGAEWVIFKKLPYIFGVGTSVLGAAIIDLNFISSLPNSESQKLIFQCLGLIFSFWFFVGTITFGCVIVMLMKGPAYVADPYELPLENEELESNKKTILK